MAQQLTFDLPADVARGREDFFTSPSNALAVAALEGWADWPGGRLSLIGAEGAGKSHLARIWAGDAQARVVEGGDLAGSDPDALSMGNLCIEDAEHAVGPEAERAFFHIFNLMGERGHALLITTRTPPARWGVSLADLKSRLATLPCAQIEPPDDALLSALLLKLFHDRQLIPPPNLIAYAVTRMERSFAAAQALVAQLDQRALERGGAITRALAGEVLDNPDR